MKITNKLKLMLKSILSLTMGEVATDKAKLYWDGEGDLEQGMEVFVEDEEGEFAPAPDGDYITEDGKTITVVEGKVSEIKDPQAEVASEPEAEEEVEAEAQTEPVAAAEEEENPAPADEEEKEEEELSLEDKVSALEAKAEEMVNALNEIVNAISALEGRIAEVEGKLAKVEEPAADPIDENPEIEERKTRLSYLRKK